MSEIKVNKITPRAACGTTQLGDSGDTFTIPSGATITNSGTASGFGATGETSWDTTVKTTGTFTATAGVGYFLNTTGGVITVNLPVGAAGSSVAMTDYAATWQTNNVTVAANGSENIGGAAAPVILNTEGQSVTFVYIDGTQGWVNVLDSTSNVRGNEFMAATVSGACNTLTTAPDCANAKIATFVGPGTFCVSAIGACAANNLVSYITVGGGGGGGYPNAGGGGGGGGFREVVSPVAPYTGSPLDGYATPGNRITVTATGFPITVGGGGGAVTNGSNTIFSTITSAGGGGGAKNSALPYDGGNGGSGGGAAGSGGPGLAAGGTGNTPPTTPAQGFNGGTNGCGGGGAAGDVNGGGGGATEVGENGSPGPLTGGRGGAGTTTSISASSLAYSGGGGAGSRPPNGGTSGAASPCGTGGAGGTNNGTTNRGGGGGGGENPSTANGAGGSGIVIIRYKFQ